MNKDGAGTLACLLRPIVCMTIPGVLSEPGGFLTGVIEGIAGLSKVREEGRGGRESGKGKDKEGRREREGGKVRDEEGSVRGTLPRTRVDTDKS
jgi:hypothetical protein